MDLSYASRLQEGRCFHKSIKSSETTFLAKTNCSAKMVYFISLIPSLLAALLFLVSPLPGAQAATAIDLGNCLDFAILGGTAVSFNGVTSSVAIGSVGVSPGFRWLVHMFLVMEALKRILMLL